jgi:hypothetical protein
MRYKMKKIALALLILFGGISLYADWIEPYGSGCSNDLYCGELNAIGGISLSDGTNTIYEERFASSLADHSSYTITAVSGKAGWGVVRASGTACWADFTFTNAGVVTLSSSTSNVAEDISVDTKLNIIDGGTYPNLVNELGSTVVFYGNIYYLD